ncbi:elongation factor Tu domain 2 protein [Sulfolobus islandicus L.S.2.15]|uniref:Elongation factor Tu domain 2 protein n=1 Tax=Saccharolobus islandicus (strain L.S.2.15 / Lassen \|nr:DUF1269 domain-containing protein [Sulfolobus islandicus]ACP35704.1 elongation factor Tu domain 2 protein [Sulfolobus islandicus L.S.2.15]
MRRIFKVNIIGLIIITLFIFSTFPYPIFLNHLVLASDANSLNGTAIDYLHFLYVPSHGNIKLLNISNNRTNVSFSYNYTLYIGNITLIYNVTKSDYSLLIYKSNVTAEYTLNSSSNGRLYLNYIIYYHQELLNNTNLYISMLIFTNESDDKQFLIMKIDFKPSNSSFNLGDLMLINKSSTLQDELHQVPKYIAYLGKLYEKSNNKTLEILGKYYVEISHVISKLNKIIPKSFLKVKLAFVGVEIQDDCPVAGAAVGGACGVEGAIWAAAVGIINPLAGLAVGVGFAIGCAIAGYYADTGSSC